MRSGTRKTPIDHRDYDLHRTYGVSTTVVFPETFSTDLGEWMPNQNTPEPIFNNPALPFGCTDYTQADLSADSLGKLQNPIALESITHANANGGADIRDSLKAAQRLGWTGTFYNVNAYAPLDFFDAIRYAMLTGVPEKRSVSWGTPWYVEWETAAQNKNPIMPSPKTYNPKGLGWHNSKMCGWVRINGVDYLKNKSWQGTTVGDNGWLYFSREVVNAVMAVPGTVAYIITNAGTPNQIAVIPTSLWQYLMSFIRNMLPFHI